MSSVCLVSITPNAEEVIARCCRTPELEDDTPRPFQDLLRGCIRRKEWSVLEMASACVGIETERDISRQLLRHRSFSFQEFSQRWRGGMPASGMFELRRKGVTKQDSFADARLNAKYKARILETQNLVRLLHDDMIRDEVHPECARRVLMECSPTRLYMHGTIRSWFHFLQVRLQSETQKEHRIIAQQIHHILSSHMPTVMGLVESSS